MTRIRPYRGAKLLLVLLCALFAQGCSGCDSPFSDLGSNIAECVRADGDVRFHGASESVWQPVRKGMGFSEGTWIQTGDEAEADVQIFPDENLKIDPNSVVILTGDRSQAASELITVVVKRGRARVKKASGAVRTVVPKKEPKPAPPKVELPPPELLEPVADRTLPLGKTLKLKWRPEAKTPRYRVQIARTASFEPLVADDLATGASWSFSPEQEGTYFWRVAGQTKEASVTPFSAARPLNVRSDLLLRPTEVERIVTRRGRARVRFAWASKAGARAYELVLSRGTNLKSNVVLKRNTPKSRLVLKSLSAGTYYWGVFSGGKALFAEPRKLVIAKDPKGLRLPSKLRWE